MSAFSVYPGRGSPSGARAAGCGLRRPAWGQESWAPPGWRLGCDGLGLILERKEEFLGQIPCFCPLFVGCGLGIPPFHPRRRPVERLVWAPGSPGRVCPCGGFQVLGAGLRLCVMYWLIPTVCPLSTVTTTGRWPGSSHMPAWSWAPWGMELWLGSGSPRGSLQRALCLSLTLFETVLVTVARCLCF